MRLTWRGTEPTREPYDTLVRVDLASGAEQPLYPEVGPQARILSPHYAPDGAWAMPRSACCLAHELLVFASGDPHPVAANSFLPAAVRDLALASPGPVAPDGRILMSVDCCMGSPPADNPNGLYLVPRDLSAAERLTRGGVARALGLGPGGGWVAALKRPVTESPAPDALTLVTLALPGGAERTLLAAGELPLAERGAVAPDGTIAVATRQTPNFPAALDALYGPSRPTAPAAS